MRLVVITGPTACGKTRLAAELAHRLRTTVLSADSRQVYRGLDIGTGKDLDEFQRFTPPVPVRLVDLADPAETYSLFRYKQDFHHALLDLSHETEIARGTRPLVVCGGTGLYLEAILRDFRLANVPEDPELRERLMKRDLDGLISELGSLDPGRRAGTDVLSKKRVVRALEIAYASREGPVDVSPPLPRPLEYLAFVVQVERRIQRERIDARLHARLDSGLVEEVAHLVKSGLTPARLDMLGMEYREIARFLRGEVTRDEMVTLLATAIHQLAKRQDTYFRGMARRGIPLVPISPDGLGSVLAALDSARFNPVG